MQYCQEGCLLTKLAAYVLFTFLNFFLSYFPVFIQSAY
jgi:hypothetical protein